MNKSTVDNYVWRKIIQAPDYYVRFCSNYSEAKFAILDHLFNTIGTGIHSLSDEIKTVKQVSKSQRERYGRIFTEDFYVEAEDSCSYSEFKKRRNKVRKIVFKDEQTSDINLILVEKNHSMKRSPYPNFEKEYSLVFKDSNFSSYEEEWILAAIDFYCECKSYFLSEDSLSYSLAFPRLGKGSIQEQAMSFQKEINSGKQLSNEEISYQYGIAFNGDYVDFLTRRWKSEKERILKFIDETLLYLTKI